MSLWSGEKNLAGIRNRTYGVHVNLCVKVTFCLVLHFLVLSLLLGLIGWDASQLSCAKMVLPRKLTTSSGDLLALHLVLKRGLPNNEQSASNSNLTNIKR